MRIYTSLNISASALSVQRRKMDIVSKNLANVDTTRTAEGGPYKREIVVVGEDKSTTNFQSLLNQTEPQLARTHSEHMPAANKLWVDRNNIGGVKVDQIVQDASQPRLVYDPSHPDANENGYVLKPNINVVTEMVDIISATRAYEANLTVVDATKKIEKKSLEL
jgi:flagellar basal-body rod protein FlgC